MIKQQLPLILIVCVGITFALVIEQTKEIVTFHGQLNVTRDSQIDTRLSSTSISRVSSGTGLPTPGADPNPTVFNSTGDLWANNEGEFVALWWEPQEGSSQYTMFRSFSVTGPWETLTSIPLSKGVDFTPDARTVNLCYRVEGIDASGAVIRSYEPVCVPKFSE